MKRKLVLIVLTLFMLTVLAASQTVTPASAQSGGGYDLTWNVIAGGGTTFSSGGNYSLSGTIGQADAETMSGESYTLSSGFWVDLFGFRIELPLIMR